VRYVLEVACARPETVFVSRASLYDAETGAHLWAGRFDGALEDMFDLQDHVTSSVVGAIAPKLQREEIKRARRKQPKIWMHTTITCVVLQALVGGPRMRTPRRSSSFASIELDPGSGLRIWHGRVVLRPAQGAWLDERARSGNAEGVRMPGKRCIWVGDDPVALCMGGYALAFVAQEFDDAAAFMDRDWRSIPTQRNAWTYAHSCTLER